ncbi:MAG: helix-turn-helix transcriptional regulator [Pedobacter sp.]|jgi:transcriptional regulator with XRE-family HTH domain|uniref:helix-turn-helix domain-containing protein n=1 Tax=Pedobacter sp. TaxID=1411316 RepID=UPI0035669764
MDWKAETKIRFANHLMSLLKAYENANPNEKNSLRAFATRSGLESSHVQRIMKGKVDVAMTTIFSLAEGLKIKPKELLDFDN